MGIYVVHFSNQNKTQWGVIKAGKICSLKNNYNSLSDLLTNGGEDLKMAATENGNLSVENVKLLSPVTAPCKIICQGVNYAEHRLESAKSETSSFNMFFTKADSSLASASDDIKCPSHVKLLDYEIELGLIIGKKIEGPLKITANNLKDYIVGIVIANDVSARDIQVPQTQFFKGKSYRTFCPVGPFLYLLDAEEIKYLDNLELKLWVNNKLRQDSSTQQLIYKPAETLTELSEIMNLNVGDLILTGTPGGVALKAPKEIIQKIGTLLFSEEKRMKIFVKMQLKRTKYLKGGDIIKAQIKSADGKIDLGIQQNKVVKL